MFTLFYHLGRRVESGLQADSYLYPSFRCNLGRSGIERAVRTTIVDDFQVCYSAWTINTLPLHKDLSGQIPIVEYAKFNAGQRN